MTRILILFQVVMKWLDTKNQLEIEYKLLMYNDIRNVD
jgi:hypothetical protein